MCLFPRSEEQCRIAEPDAIIRYQQPYQGDCVPLEPYQGGCASLQPYQGECASLQLYPRDCAVSKVSTELHQFHSEAQSHSSKIWFKPSVTRLFATFLTNKLIEKIQVCNKYGANLTFRTEGGKRTSALGWRWKRPKSAREYKVCTLLLKSGPDWHLCPS